ncbi:MAG: PepSY domain-containing protein [Saccharofermentanales bacterium]
MKLLQNKKIMITLIASIVIAFAGFSTYAIVSSGTPTAAAADITSGATAKVTPKPTTNPTAAPTANPTAAPTATPTTPANNTGSALIGIAKLNDIVLGKVPGSIIVKIELDYEDNKKIYEVKAFVGMVEYKYEIDAFTGAILEFKTDNNIDAINDDDDEDYDDEDDDDKNIDQNKSGIDDDDDEDDDEDDGDDD